MNNDMVYFVTQRLNNGVITVFGTSGWFRPHIKEEGHAVLAEFTKAEEAKRERDRLRGLGNRLVHPPECGCGDKRYHS